MVAKKGGNFCSLAGSQAGPIAVDPERGGCISTIRPPPRTLEADDAEGQGDADADGPLVVVVPLGHGAATRDGL